MVRFIVHVEIEFAEPLDSIELEGIRSELLIHMEGLPYFANTVYTDVTIEEEDS